MAADTMDLLGGVTNTQTAQAQPASSAMIDLDDMLGGGPSVGSAA
jgi:hypothetical protein